MIRWRSSRVGELLRAVGVFTARARLADSIRATIQEPEAAIATGVLLGLRSNIPPDITHDFKQTATTHILAVSGQNLTVVAGLIAILCGRLLARRHPAFF